MKSKDFKKLFVCLGLFLIAFSGRAAAGDVDSPQQLAGLIKELQKQMADMKGIIESQNNKIRQLESRGPQVQTASGTITETIQSSNPAPMSDYEFNQRLDNATGGAQKWLKDLKFSGDLRLRYEAFANDGTYSDPDRNRFRFRLRYGFEKQFGDQMKVGFSMASGEKTTNTGHNGDPTSTNQTMGNLADFKNIWIEKAYGSYMPNWIKIGPVKSAEFTGGKFTNPFEKGSSDLVFDRDLKPEGAYETMAFDLLDTPDVKLGGYVTVGQFILQENSTIGKDATMFGYQVGLNPTVYTPLMDRPVDLLGAVSFYDYSNYDKNMNWRIDQVAAGQSLANGNSVCDANNLCTGYRVFEYYSEMKLTPYAGIPITPFVDVAHNTFSGRSMLDQNAWTLGLKVGKQLQKGDWQASYQYKWIGADSVPGAFSDSDFGYNGYNGHKGSVIRLGYMLTDNLTLNAAAYIVRNLDIGSRIDWTSTSRIKSEQQSRFQLDLVWKF